MRVSRRTRQSRVLHELIESQGFEPSHYALFFVTGEGIEMPWLDENGCPLEETSGHVIADNGQVFAFWMAWDPEREGPALVEWEEETPELDWLRSREYREARLSIGLPVPW